MESPNQTLLARFAALTSVFAIVMVSFVAAKGSSGDGNATSAASAAPVPVTLSEFAINPGGVSLPKGGSLSVTNGGSQVHNLAITGTDLKTTDMSGGGAESLDLSSLAPGPYELMCEIPGHKEAGMFTTLTVTEGDTGTNEVAAEDFPEVDHSQLHNVDLSTLEATDEHAKRINEAMKDSMDEGVQTFLDFAERYANDDVEKGNRELVPEIGADGTKHFYLTASIEDWQVNPGNIVKAWTYNGMVPGPLIKLQPNDKVAVHLRNELPIATDIHWHGIDVPWEMDGVAPITQDYIDPLEDFVYEFTAPSFPQLGMYHAHMHGQEAIVNGLFAIVQVGQIDLPRGRTIAGLDVPEDLVVDHEIPMVLNDAGVIGLSLNGKAFPETEPIVAKKGEWVLMHYYNEGLQGHPMHLHRQPHLVVAKDGYPLAEPYRVDTVWVSPGERYSVLIKAEEVGTWAFHCHIVSHAESAEGFIGMVSLMIVTED
ncbi:MAG: multicopper oxidase domain-containing protein [Aquihabitans sp.]